MRYFGRSCVALVVVLLVAPVSAQTIGYIDSHKDIASLTERGAPEVWKVIDQNHVPLVLDTKLKTDDNGQLSAVVVDPKLGAVQSGFDMMPRTEIELVEDLFEPGLPREELIRMHGGGIKFTGAGIPVVAGEGGARSRKTEFIVLYDRAAGSARIIGVSGTVSASNRTIKGSAIDVGPQQETLVVNGRAPTKPTKMTDDAFQSLVRQFAFIDTGREKAEVASLVEGTVLRPDNDRAPSHSMRKVWDEWPGPRFPDPVWEQPPGPVQAAGLGINF